MLLLALFKVHFLSGWGLVKALLNINIIILLLERESNHQSEGQLLLYSGQILGSFYKPP